MLNFLEFNHPFIIGPPKHHPIQADVAESFYVFQSLYATAGNELDPGKLVHQVTVQLERGALDDAFLRDIRGFKKFKAAAVEVLYVLKQINLGIPLPTLNGNFSAFGGVAERILSYLPMK